MSNNFINQISNSNQSDRRHYQIRVLGKPARIATCVRVGDVNVVLSPATEFAGTLRFTK
jgi:hypothetical protein